MNDALQFGAHLLQVGPQALLDIEGVPLQRAVEVGILDAHQIAMAGLHQGHAVLKGSLQIGHAAQELDFVLLQRVLPLHAPSGPMVAHVLHLVADALLFGQPRSHLREGAIGLALRFQDRVGVVHDLAVELHLLADVPVEHARQEALPGLDHGVEDAARARVHGPDGGHFAEGCVARVQQRQEIGQRDVDTRGGLRIAGAHAFAHFAEDRDQFSAFHGAPSGSGSRLR